MGRNDTYKLAYMLCISINTTAIRHVEVATLTGPGATHLIQGKLTDGCHDAVCHRAQLLLVLVSLGGNVQHVRAALGCLLVAGCSGSSAPQQLSKVVLSCSDCPPSYVPSFPVSAGRLTAVDAQQLPEQPCTYTACSKHMARPLSAALMAHTYTQAG